MAEEYDPFADLGSQDPFEDAIPKAKVRVMAYGPVVGEHHRAAMFGPNDNELQPYDVAASPNLGLKLGEWIEVNGQARRVADWSYIKPGVPTKDTIEIRDAQDQGHGTINRINLSTEEIQKRISEYPQLAGERTTAAERKAVEPADVKGDPFADLIPTEKPVAPSGPDPFSDLTPPPPRGFKGLEPGQPIEGSPTPTPLPDITTPKPSETPKQKRGGMTIPTTAPRPALTFSPVPSLPMMDIPTTGVQPPPPIEAPSALPTPQGEEDPNIYEKTIRALGAYGAQMVPQSVEQAVQLTGVPTDLTDPFADLGFLFPPLRPTIMAGQQAFHRMQQIQEAEQTPAMSQPRFDAGIGTALDLLGMATIGGGVKAGMGMKGKFVKIGPNDVIRGTSREVPVPETFQPRGATVSESPTLYHGTPRGEFESMKESEGGLFFTTNPELAQSYTQNRGLWLSKSKTPQVYEAQVGFENPLVIDALGTRYDNIPVPWQEWKPKAFGNLPKNAVNVRDAVKYAKEHGHDGLIVKNVIDTLDPESRVKSDVHVAFSPNQVKGLSAQQPRPAPQLPEPLQFKVDMPTDTFATEFTPVSSALHEMKMVSKSGAKLTRRYKGNEALWDDAPALSHPTHNKIYSPYGAMPDVAAQSLYDAGLISDPSVQALWNAVAAESKSARSALKSQRGTAVAIQQGVKVKAQQTTAFIKAEQAAWKGGEPPIPVKDLQVGDTVTIADETFKVTDIDPDTFDVTLEDGRKFGIQTVNDNAVIYGEHESTFARPPVEPPETPPPTQPPAARPPPAAPTPPPVPQGSETVNPVRGSGKFVRSYRIDKELGDRMEGIGAARESGALRAETEARNLLDGLTPAQETDLGRYLVSRRLRTVNPDHPQIISDIEMRRIESDPALAKALDYYKAKIKPDIEGWRKRAGLSEEAAAGKEAEFISLIARNPLDQFPVKQGNTFVNVNRLPRTTQFARAAAGFAREYAVNMRDILTDSYGEVIRKARTREFLDASVRKGVLAKATVRMPDGNFVKIAQIEDLPADLHHDLTEATKANLAPVGLQKVGRIYQRAVTGAALTANPAELVNHMRRQLNLVAAKPPIGMGLLARLEALVPYFGPKLGAFKRTIMDNMSTPENQAILRDIYDAGGGSSRSFEELYGAHPKKPFAKALHKYTGLEWLQRKTQNLLFGIPKGYGIGGWDLRMRVQLEKIRRSAEGNVDPQRIREFANQIGQYGRHTSWAVSALRAINPYAATTLPMRLTELKTVIGSTGLKEKPLAPSTLAHRGETIARGTGGTILALTTANYLLSGKWPWENDKGHEFDLNTGVTSKDGKNVYVKLRAIAPEFSRPVGTFSIPELLRERTAKHPQYLSAGFTGAANQAASLVSGPGQNLLLTAATGKVPYFLKRPGEGPELMDVAMMKKGERGQSRGLRQLKAAAAGVNPFGELFGPHFDVEIEGGLKYLEGIPGFKPFGRIFSTSYEKKHGRSGMAPLAIPPPPSR